MIYSIFYFLMFSSSFIAMQYLNLYYKQIGFSVIQITVIIIVSTIMSVGSSLYLGYKFDKSNKKHKILFFILVSSIISFISIYYFERYEYILIANIIFSMVYFSVQPLFTTITLINIEKNCLNFGKVRLYGTIGFCATSIILPMIKYENAIFIAMAIVMTLMIVTFFVILKKDRINNDIKENEKFKLSELFQNKIIIKLMMFIFIINITLGAYFNFFGIYYTEELGYSKELFGILCAVSTLSEIPFLLLSSKIFEKFNIKSILIISGLITGIRWLLCAFFTQAVILLSIQILHGFGFIVLSTSINIYINNNCQDKYKATMQSIFFVGTLVFSKVIGSIVGGFLPQLLSQKSVFIFNFLICSIATVILMFRLKSKDIKPICN